MPASRRPRQSLEELLIEAFTKVAQHACRMGEARSRDWQPLSQLPAPDEWRMVGERYAREFSAQLLEHYIGKDLASELLRSSSVIQSGSTPPKSGTP